ncbi:hypothetical protein B0H19DRAFT_1241904 [Mycena capillaripes]|nr:hypothetical protein B0H19DRAFT_1241904 [Mycena capillaripes]
MVHSFWGRRRAGWWSSTKDEEGVGPIRQESVMGNRRERGSKAEYRAGRTRRPQGKAARVIELLKRKLDEERKKVRWRRVKLVVVLIQHCIFFNPKQFITNPPTDRGNPQSSPIHYTSASTSLSFGRAVVAGLDVSLNSIFPNPSATCASDNDDAPP